MSVAYKCTACTWNMALESVSPTHEPKCEKCGARMETQSVPLGVERALRSGDPDDWTPAEMCAWAANEVTMEKAIVIYVDNEGELISLNAKTKGVNDIVSMLEIIKLSAYMKGAE